MLAAPSRNAVQTLRGGPGRSSAATTSHRISSAGAMAAVPMTVGRDSRRFIRMANKPFFPIIHCSKQSACRRGQPTTPGQFCAASQCTGQPRQMFLNRAFTRSSSSAPTAARSRFAQAAIATARTLISHPVAVGTGQKMQAISYRLRISNSIKELARSLQGACRISPSKMRAIASSVHGRPLRKHTAAGARSGVIRCDRQARRRTG